MHAPPLGLICFSATGAWRAELRPTAPGLQLGWTSCTCLLSCFLPGDATKCHACWNWTQDLWTRELCCLSQPNLAQKPRQIHWCHNLTCGVVWAWLYYMVIYFSFLFFLFFKSMYCKFTHWGFKERFLVTFSKGRNHMFSEGCFKASGFSSFLCTDVTSIFSGCVATVAVWGCHLWGVQENWW